jgi:ABC-type glycerol-3-phosphate transport system substrate-binding protein
MLLVTIIAACADNDGGSQATPPPGDSGTPAAPPASGTETPAADRDYYEFEFYANYEWYDTAPVWGEDLVSAYMLERFNTGMRLSKPDIDPNQMMGIMISGGELPDVMMIERDSVLLQLVELDLLLPLDEFLPGSNYAELLSTSTINMSRINGQVYGLLNWATNEPTGNGGWMVNRDIYEQLGSPPLNTTDQLKDYLILVRDSNITVDGMPVVPMQFGHSNAIWDIGLASFGAQHVEGVSDINGELKLYMTNPDAEEGFVWLNSLWNENLINSDHFVETSEQIMEKLAMGRFAVYAGHDVTADVSTQVRPVFLENNPGNEFLVIPPPAAAGVNQASIWNSRWSSLGWNIVVITRNAQDPQRIFELLDFINSQEGQVLTYYGPQGALWNELDAQGFPYLIRTPEELSAEESNEVGANIRWNKVGNTGVAHRMGGAIRDRIPREEWTWGDLAQQDVIYKHSFNADAFLNMSPNPQEPEGIAQSTYEELNERHVPRIITAANEAAARAALQEAIDAIYSQNFRLVEEFKTEIYKQNLALIG